MSTPPAAAPAETCPWCLALAYRSPASAPTPSPSTRSSTACESTSPGTRACARRPVTSSRRSVTPSAGAGLCATSHRSPDLRRSAGSVARAVDYVITHELFHVHHPDHTSGMAPPDDPDHAKLVETKAPPRGITSLRIGMERDEPGSRPSGAHQRFSLSLVSRRSAAKNPRPAPRGRPARSTNRPCPHRPAHADS